ncbi:hypothetical protein [Propionibacterium australiense]|uniref:Uncharacterized protein n=1 Tax=Propionibacterium australiense TaxID=119981 RepID=A0A383S598_9ACTN|nr:hypothetical protein [Propionibacterium australiense]SYZ32584.1 Hypothetical protein PROPAUS_0469 [Propionibacterium australiense]VEH91665.1 Uncharacterised protein [Propionibacterium australiense]
MTSTTSPGAGAARRPASFCSSTTLLAAALAIVIGLGLGWGLLSPVNAPFLAFPSVIASAILVVLAVIGLFRDGSRVRIGDVLFIVAAAADAVIVQLTDHTLRPVSAAMLAAVVVMYAAIVLGIVFVSRRAADTADTPRAVEPQYPSGPPQRAAGGDAGSDGAGGATGDGGQAGPE